MRELTMKIASTLILASLLPVFAACHSQKAEGDAQAGRPRGPSGIIYLDKSSNWAQGLANTAHNDHLSREIVRQSLLLAAREELGLGTRDACLEEPMPQQGPLPRVDVSPSPESVSILETAPGAATATVLGQAEIPLSGGPDYSLLVANAEKLSRGKFVEILKQSGYEGKALPPQADRDVPPAIERSLSEMTFTSQFYAVRRLHELIRSEGESAARVGALVRGYANLGWQTEFYFHPAHNVFKARALLYAQRMASRDEHSAWARWHKAYAWVAAGRPVDALADLAAAEKDKAAAKGSLAKPAWVELLDAYCRFDHERLKTLRTSSAGDPLVRFLSYLAMEKADSENGATAMAIADLRAMPDCYRMYSGLNKIGGLAVLHQTTLSGLLYANTRLAEQLDAMSDLPDGARQLVATQKASRGKPGGPAQMNQKQVAADFESRAGLAKSLLAADDRGEPAWAALGCLMRELNFSQAWQRVRFERYMYCVPADGFIRLATPLVRDHPYHGLVESCLSDPAAVRRAIGQMAASPPLDIEPQAAAFWETLVPMQTAAGKAAKQRALANASETDCQLISCIHNERRMPAKGVPFARALLRASPYSPYAIAILIQRDWTSVEKLAAGWEKTGSRQPAILGALGIHFATVGDLAAAERYLKAAAELAPSVENYGRLADFYRAYSKTEQFLATLEKILQLPDYGLSHSHARQEIAAYFMARKEFTKALPYAEAAAESYSNSSLDTVALCYEGLGRWKEAEDTWKAIAERYPSEGMGWFFFCKRTGHGDVEAARTVLLDSTKESAAMPRISQQSLLSVYYQAENQFEKSLEIEQSLWNAHHSTKTGLALATLADRLKDAARRDAALKQVIEDAAKPPPKELSAVAAAYGEYPSKPLAALAELMVKDLADGGKGQIDLAAADALAARAPNNEKPVFYYHLACYLDRHGKPDKAVSYWKKGAAFPRDVNIPLPLCETRLTERGIKPENYLTEPKQPAPKTPDDKP
jgi:hypothetical protein